MDVLNIFGGPRPGICKAGNFVRIISEKNILWYWIFHVGKRNRKITIARNIRHRKKSVKNTRSIRKLLLKHFICKTLIHKRL